MAGEKIISALIGGAAGGLVSYTTNLFQYRRAARDEIIELSHDLYGDIAVYWMRPGSDIRLENAIVKSSRKLASKSKAYATLYLSYACKNDLDRRLIRLLGLCSGEDFASRDKVVRPEIVEQSDALFREIRVELCRFWVSGTLRRMFNFGK